MAVDPPTFGRIRVMLASLLTLGLAGTVIELVLLDHVEEWRQLLMDEEAPDRPTWLAVLYG